MYKQRQNINYGKQSKKTYRAQGDGVGGGP